MARIILLDSIFKEKKTMGISLGPLISTSFDRLTKQSDHDNNQEATRLATEHAMYLQVKLCLCKYSCLNRSAYLSHSPPKTPYVTVLFTVD